MQVTIDITSDEAEMLLFALALRSKQVKLSAHRQDEAVVLGHSLDKTFTKAFGWDGSIDRMYHNRYPIKSVSIRMYDFPPTS